MYFIPDFDATDGYYQAADGVCSPKILDSSNTHDRRSVVVVLG